jgi:hypothetical protein
MFRLTWVIVRLSLEPVNVFDNYVHFGIPKGLQCLQGSNIYRYLNVLWLWVVCLIPMYLHLSMFAVLPAPFRITRYSCSCWLSCCFPRVQSYCLLFCAPVCFLETCFGFGLGLLAAGAVAVVLQFFVLLYLSQGSRVSAFCCAHCVVLVGLCFLSSF